MIGHILKYENKLIYKLIEGETKGKRDRGWPRTSFVKQMISDAKLSSYTKLKRLAGNKEECRAYIQLQNQPWGWIQKEEKCTYSNYLKNNNELIPIVKYFICEKFNFFFL
jgi:hypothetical protein